MLQAAGRALRRFLLDAKKASTPRVYDFREELMIWDFTKEDVLKQWSCICDKDMNGHSIASISPNGKGTGILFHGNLSTQPPVNHSGTVKYTGYCAIRSKPQKGSWFEKGTFDISEFDALQFRVRGDGRRFIANLGAPGIGRKDDVWQCFLFTRGGPEWEDITLPFGDFFVTHRGYMQDVPFYFNRTAVGTFGLLLVDRVEGPFELELQHIKAVRTLIPQPESRIE